MLLGGNQYIGFDIFGYNFNNYEGYYLLLFRLWKKVGIAGATQADD